MIARLLGIGCAAPERRLARAGAVALARSLAPSGTDPALLQALHRGSGIRERGVVIGGPVGDHPAFAPDPAGRGPTTGARLGGYTRAATALARPAAEAALAEAATAPPAITHLVTASCTGFEAPGFDQHLARALGLRPDVRRTHVGFMGCHAAVNALAVADAFARTDPEARVLVCCAELCSLHYHYGDRKDRLVANALFADGAAAAVVGVADGADAPGIARFGAAVIDASDSLMHWRIGDHGFEMALSVDVPKVIGAAVGPWVDGMLARDGLVRGDVGGWAIHPGGPRVVETVADALGLDADAAAPSRKVLRDHGNMSSATLLFILRRLHERAAPRPWVALAFGPGLAAEGLVLR